MNFYLFQNLNAKTYIYRAFEARFKPYLSIRNLKIIVNKITRIM